MNKRNSKPKADFDPELYQEMMTDKGCQYDDEIKEEMFENMMKDYL